MSKEKYLEGDIPGGMGAQPGEGDENASEKFRENLRKTQAAIKKIHQEESKAKVYDHSLFAVVTALLKKGDEDDIIVLIADLLEANIPSDFILALISLYVNEARMYLKTEFYPELETKALTLVIGKVDESSIFTESTLQEINKWAEDVIKNAYKDVEKVLETIIEAETWDLHPSIIRLTALIIQKYLNMKNETIEYEELLAFSQSFLRRLLEALQNALYAGQSMVRAA